MSASEAAVKATMNAMGCWQRPDLGFGVHGMICGHCSDPRLVYRWTERGCPNAVRAADTAVDVDRASIQAETLREAAKIVRARTTAGNADVGPNGRQLERRAIANMLSVKAWDVLGNRAASS